jgi:hypothetical protein
MAETLPRVAPPPRPVRPVAPIRGMGKFRKASFVHNYSSLLAVSGSLCLTITLVLAWYLVGVRSSAFLKKVFPSY